MKTSIFLGFVGCFLVVCASAVEAQGDISQPVREWVKEELSLLRKEKDLEIGELRQENSELRQEIKELKSGQPTAQNDRAAFSVARRNNGQVMNAGDKAQYNTVITNVGGGYSTSSHEFVAPSTGTYAFGYSVAANSVSSQQGCHLFLQKNDDPQSNAYVEAFGADNQNGIRHGSNMAVLELNTGDRVSLKTDRACTLDGTTWKTTSFSGFQIN